MASIPSGNAATSAALPKCAHTACSCTVTAGERFCSDHCLADSGEDAVTVSEGCQCGHPECEQLAGIATPPGPTFGIAG